LGLKNSAAVPLPVGETGGSKGKGGGRGGGSPGLHKPSEAPARKVGDTPADGVLQRAYPSPREGRSP
jgi:hypothetical protein